MKIAQDIKNHPAYIRKIRSAAGEIAQQVHSKAPTVDVGLFDYPKWEAGKAYAAGDLFMHHGQPGFVRQDHTSLENWMPFMPGTESLYGARPRQLPDGTYPYVYNMRAEKDMRVRSAKDDNVYVCIQPTDFLLYDPADVPALFQLEQ